jgi:CHAT domain-containing protein
MRNMKRHILFLIITFFFTLQLSAQEDLIVKSDSLIEVGYKMYEAKKYEKAILLFSQSAAIYKDIYGERSTEYATIIGSIAYIYSEIGNYNKAIEIGTQALEIEKKVLNKKDISYIGSLLNTLASNYSALGNYNKAIEIGTQALGIIKEVYGEKHSYYTTLLSSLAKYYSEIGNYNKAIEIGTQALEIKISEHSQCAIPLSNLAKYYSEIGNYDKAIEIGTQALKIGKDELGEKHPDYATSLNNLAYYYFYLGNYNKAIEIGTQALEIRKEVLGEEHPDYATSLNNLANTYATLSNYNKAIELETQALEINKKILGEKHPDYATLLNNLAYYYSALGNYNKAIEIGTQALKIRKEALGGKHPLYATSLNNLANTYATLSDYNKAIELETQALEINKKILGEKHPDYATSLKNLGNFYFKSNNLEKGSQYLSQSIRMRTKNITNTFKGLTTQQRELYWHAQKYAFDEASEYAFYSHNNTVLLSTAYNASLLSKGLLLNSDIEFSKLIAESGDNAVIQKNQRLTDIRNILNKLYEQPIDKRFMSTDSLENIAEDLEHQLVKESKIFGDYTKNMSIQWPDIQRALKPQDAAIEFTTFPCRNDSVMYAAMLLRKDSKYPVMIPLFEKAQMDSLSLADQLTLKEALTGISDKKKYIYNNVKLGRMVWQPLAEQLNGVKNIYFSPSGILHQIAIEYLPLNDSVNIASKYNLYRLSSTRQLALIHDRESIKSAALYGGLIYDMDSTMLIKKHKLYEDKIPMLASRDVELIDTLSQRFGLDYLRGTLIEVNEIDKTLKQGRIPTQYYTDINGTEESVKVLSEKRINLLHIATHGFYWTPQKAKRMEHLGFLQASNSKNDTEDQSLTRSGLLFAGANLAWNGKEVPTGIEDGILTSKELSQLDLRGLDLVVMSACQTGLGEITGEGVFGLQRGFKKAGANTLVMSLWKVDDKATEVMMSQFYKNLMTGQSKRQAFLNAQQYLRNYSYTTDKDTVIKFDDPKYWAAFIMLDGN